VPTTAGHGGTTQPPSWALGHADRALLPAQSPWQRSPTLPVGSLAHSCFLTSAPLVLDTVPRAQALAAAPHPGAGHGLCTGKGTGSTLHRAGHPAVLHLGDGTGSTGNGGGLWGLCVGRVLAVLCTGLPPCRPFSLLNLRRR